jgi:hypothetical protein
MNYQENISFMRRKNEERSNLISRVDCLNSQLKAALAKMKAEYKKLSSKKYAFLPTSEFEKLTTKYCLLNRHLDDTLDKIKTKLR